MAPGTDPTFKGIWDIFMACSRQDAREIEIRPCAPPRRVVAVRAQVQAQARARRSLVRTGRAC
ncbi:hypothetical protein MTDSW087_01284 [Methylobacterium dankookense]|uniref:Uncharacterized protein n=1 Tax=Methylobacterium dankookense TaxID=560405 RepID=A0A564FW04_9HYPH|nr:hypothetical protein IFDJLNFL_1211 [Methylobacterium dankookense]VUF11601.1 hypothetical protein MTDSW087_01284 [Methylobacterium dankookense]